MGDFFLAAFGPQTLWLKKLNLHRTGFFSNFVLTPLSAEISGAVDQIEAANPGFSGKKGVYAQATSLFEIAIAAAALVGPQVSGQAMQHLGWDNTVLILGVWFASVALPVVSLN